MKHTSLRFAHVTFAGLLLLLGAVSLSCSFSSNPSEADATKALEEMCKQNNNLCKVNSLRKTDGAESEESKVKHYRLAYEAELECLRANTSPPQGGVPSIRMGYPPAWCEKVGEIKKVRGVFEFVKTEKGWQTELTNMADLPREVN